MAGFDPADILYYDIIYHIRACLSTTMGMLMKSIPFPKRGKSLAIFGLGW